MMNSISQAFLVPSFAVALFAAAAFGQQDDVTMPLDERFSEMPAALREAFETYARFELQQKSREDAFRQQLAAADQPERKALLKYIADLTVLSFGTQSKEKIGESEDIWGAGMVVLATPRDVILEALVDHLGEDDSFWSIMTNGDQDLRKYLEYEIEGVRPSIEAYVSFLARHKPKSGDQLVGYLLRRYPERSFPALVDILVESRSDQRRLTAQHYQIWTFLMNAQTAAKSKPDAEISSVVRRFGEHHWWWVRLYIAELMQKNSALRVPDVMERLSKDEETAVFRIPDHP